MSEAPSARSGAPHFPAQALIDAYGNGGFRFADMSHRGSLLSLPDGIWAWDVADPRDIDERSLKQALAQHDLIDTLLIGTGTSIVPLHAPLRALLRQMSIQADAMQTGAAIRTYNIMIGERRRVAAALIAVE